MMFIIQVVVWILLIYGVLSLIQDIIGEFTYKNIKHNMKIIVFTKELEENLEEFMRELSKLKRNNNYKEIIVIDLDNNADIEKINSKFLEQEVNLNLLDRQSGIEYIGKYLNEKNVSFL